MDSEAGSAAALQAASEAHGGRCPDAFFLCAGASRPSFFIDQNEESMRKDMDSSYGAQAFTALVMPYPLDAAVYAHADCRQPRKKW